MEGPWEPWNNNNGGGIKRENKNKGIKKINLGVNKEE